MKRFISLVIICFFGFFPLSADTLPEKWNLKTCIDYALEHNIQVKKSKVSWEEEQENIRLSHAQLFPSLSFSTTHDWVNRPYAGTRQGVDKNSYTGSYGVSSSMTLYNGGKLRLEVSQQKLAGQIQELYVREAENSIQIAVTESFLQVLYAMESVEINRNTVEVSAAQCERARQLLEAGSLSRSDLAQLEAQYSADKYQLISAEAVLAQQKLELKQLLELDILQEVNLDALWLKETDVIRALPGKTEAYKAALNFMPEVKSGRLAIASADYEVSLARSGYLPALSLNAGVGSNHLSGTTNSFTNQFKKNLNESIGVSLSIPVYSKRQNKTAVKIAQLQVENADLEYQNIQKELLKTVEDVYLDAVSYQNRYMAAMESVKAAKVSFELVQEQFGLGMKNTVELLTEKNNLLSAQQEMIQAKYMAVLSYQLLNFYQGKGIDIKE